MIGLPTFVGGTLLGIRATGGNLLLVIILLIIFVKIYEIVYEYLFQDYDLVGKSLRLALFFIAQIFAWGFALIIANQLLFQSA